MLSSTVSERTSQRQRTQYAFFLSCVAALGGFLFGYDLVIISGAQIFLKQQFALSPGQFGFAVSSAILGCIAGPSLGAWLCDKIGRKTTLLAAGILFVVGALGTTFAANIAMFNTFRIGGGVGVGLASLAAPMYIAELAPADWRGRLGLMYQFAVVSGAFSATIVSYFLARYVAPELSWRLMFASFLAPVSVFIILLLQVPEAPRWLAEKGRIEEALQILSRVNREDQSRKELDEIRKSLADETGSVAELFEPGMRRALLVGVALALFNNWTGWTGLAYYLPFLFQQCGYPRAAAAIGVNVIIMGGSLILTAISIWLVDRVGRRPIWLITSLAMFFCLLAAGLVFQSHLQGPIAVAVIFLCAAPHSIGLGPLPWLMMSELYPTRIRARAVSITTTCLWIAGFTAPLAFPTIENTSKRVLGSGAGVFWFYSAVCVLSFLWALKFLPETKGRSLEEIADSWRINA